MSSLIALRERHYTMTGIVKAAAAISEMRTLLLAWKPGEEPRDFLARVQESGVLAKATAYRTNDLVTRVFWPRLLVEGDHPARCLKRFIERQGDNQTFREMLFLHTARAEAIFYDFICEKFWPSVRAGEILFSKQNAVAFLDEAAEKGFIQEVWSEATRERTAQGLITTLTDFGFLHGKRAERREIVVYRLSDSGLAYLAHDLHLAGFPDGALVEHPDWCLFGLDRSHLLDRLDALPPTCGLLVQRAGSVVRMTWKYSSMEEFIDAIT